MASANTKLLETVSLNSLVSKRIISPPIFSFKEWQPFAVVATFALYQVYENLAMKVDFGQSERGVDDDFI